MPSGTGSAGASVCCGIRVSNPLLPAGIIIKMTSSTSKISINGTTFISGTMPRLPPTTMPMSHLAPRIAPRGGLSHPAKNLLTGFELRRDQPNFVDARAAHDVNGARDFHEQHIVIAFDKSDFLGAFFENLFHARSEAIPGDIFIVDFHLAVGQHLHHDRLILELLVLLLILVRLRHQRVQAFGRQRRDHHENDDQHEQNINQRHDVWRRERSGTCSYIHPHCESPVAPWHASPGPSNRAGWELARPLILVTAAWPTSLVTTQQSASSQQTSGAISDAKRSSVRRWRRRRLAALLVFLRQQAQLIDASGTDFVHDSDDVSVFRAGIAFNEHGFID